jgi:hypothetical protein
LGVREILSDRLYFLTESLRIVKLLAMSDDEAIESNTQVQQEGDGHSSSDSDSGALTSTRSQKGQAKKSSSKGKKRKKTGGGSRSRSKSSKSKKDTVEVDSDEDEGDPAWLTYFRGMVWTKLDKEAMQLVGRSPKPILWPGFKKTKAHPLASVLRFPTQAEQGVAVLNNFFIYNATGTAGKVDVGSAKVIP